MILEAIAGIMAQDFQDWELLVEDGGESVEGILPRDPRIKYYPQIDPLDRRGDMVMRLARGELLNYHADDDVLLPGALSFVSNAIGDRKWMYGRITYGISISSCSIDCLSGDATWGSPWNYDRLKRENFIPAPATFWTREARDIVSGWDLANPRSHDWDYWLRLGARWEPLFVERVLAYYRIHRGSATETMPQGYKDVMDDIIRDRARSGYYDAKDES